MLPQIRLDRSVAAPLHHQLGDRLRRLIISSALPPGTRLPSTREAAAELGVSRNVVVLAYEQLKLEGYLDASVGIGTWVPRTLARHLQPPGGSAGSPGAAVRPGPHLSRGGGRLAGGRPGSPASRPTRPFRPSGIAADLFPSRIWSRLSARIWRSRGERLVFYGDVQGYRPLRELIAEHLARYRGVRCDPDRILMTSGSQQSIDLIARMLIDPEDRVAMEEPGYPGATSALSAAGAHLIPVPVDRDGLDLASAAEKGGDVRLIYTTPSHQYPLGVTLSLERRLALLEWAQGRRRWIIEDDYDSEFRFEARPLPALQGLDEAGCVLYVGTFSKVLAPGLRIGFIVLPEQLVEPFVRAREVVDQHPSLPIQATLAEFMAEGHLERHIARMRSVYSERRGALRAAIHSAFGNRFPIVPGDAGLHLTLLLGEGLDDAEVSRLAEARGVDAEPLSSHFIGPKRVSGLVLGYGGFPAERLASAMDALAECVARAEMPSALNCCSSSSPE